MVAAKHGGGHGGKFGHGSDGVEYGPGEGVLAQEGGLPYGSYINGTAAPGYVIGGSVDGAASAAGATGYATTWAQPSGQVEHCTVLTGDLRRSRLQRVVKAFALV